MNHDQKDESGAVKRASGMWGMFVTESFEEKSVNIRNAWLAVTHPPSVEPSNNITVVDVLYRWRNPNPSVSVKYMLSSDDAPLAHGDSMGLSCCVDGFRIVHYSTGEIKAEYCLIFSYGSITYVKWKSYSDFEEYVAGLHFIHHNIKPLFTQTMKDWKDVQTIKKWFRCLSVPYLRRKSIYIGKVIQSSLHECPTPGLLLEFVQFNRRT
mmetsp:Transcript_22111/g.32210  ORF Transcript_22111/g.32210 Transcript_22111/m.32210 type:complete len:209 (-) Transcript_22111:188-814(-)